MHDKIKQGFLQACINHGSLTSDMVINILTPMCETYNEDVPSEMSALAEFVQQINSSITQFNQTLTFIKHPLAGDFLVFGFTSESQVSKLQSHYTDADRYYFFKLVEALVNSEEYGISWSAVYSVVPVTPGQKPISKNHIQELLQGWTKQGYFLEKDTSIYIGPRMLVEYSSHLKTNFPDLVKDCPLCSKLVLWDITCSECKTKMHRECIRKYLIKKSTCPSCQKTWNTQLSLSQN